MFQWLRNLFDVEYPRAGADAGGVASRRPGSTGTTSEGRPK